MRTLWTGYSLDMLRPGQTVDFKSVATMHLT